MKEGGRKEGDVLTFTGTAIQKQAEGNYTLYYPMDKKGMILYDSTHIKIFELFLVAVDWRPLRSASRPVLFRSFHIRFSTRSCFMAVMQRTCLSPFLSLSALLGITPLRVLFFFFFSVYFFGALS